MIFILDNIYTKNNFTRLKQKRPKYINEKTIYFYFFVRLNWNTVELLFANGFILINNENDVKQLINKEFLNKTNINT